MPDDAPAPAALNERRAWLVNELSGLGVTLRIGEVVTTGTCIVPPPIAPGDRVRVDFGALGSVDIRMGASIAERLPY